MRTAALLLSLLSAPSIFAADPAATATGSLRSQSVTLELRSAVAFRGRSLVSENDALIVAVSNARLNAEAIADYFDRRRVLEARVKDAATTVAYFEFDPRGAYRGMRYFLGPGNGCDFCAEDVVSTVEFTPGRLSGTLTRGQADPTLAIMLAVPVLTDDHGAALPADGGAPGVAYLAYHAAMAKADRAALKPLLSQEQQRFWDESERAGKLGTWLHAMALGHPAKSVAIERGFGNADKAVLVIAGEASGGRIVGEALLVREGGQWRVDDEITEKVR